MSSAKAAVIAALLLCAPILLASASAAGSFTPRQVPAVDDPQTDYNDSDLCVRLGGELDPARNGEHVCSGLDRNDTFCIVGAAEALPCRGLFKHVILCNAGHNRPALNPFFCGANCADRRARGGKCEIAVTPADSAIVSLAATVYAAAGYAGPAGAVEVKTGRTLDFALPENFPLTLAKTPEGFAVRIRPPGLAASLEATLTAGITCAECYPAALTVAAAFIPVFAPPQSSFIADEGIALSAVFFRLPSLSDYPGLSGADFADADANDEFTVAADGRVTGTPTRSGKRALRGHWTAAEMLGTLTLEINVTKTPTEASRILEDALPENARAFTVFAPYDFEGAARRFESRDPRASLIFSPQAAGGLSIAADGGVYVAAPLARIARAEFEAVVTVVLANVSGSPRFAEISVAAEVSPLERIPRIVLNARTGDDLSAVSLLAERAAPSLPLLAGASLRVPAGAVLPEGFSRAANDDARGPVSLVAGDFDIPFLAAGGAFVGEVAGVLRVVGNPPSLPSSRALRFAGNDLTVRMDGADGLRDAGGKEFDAAYWGRRRGLHFMVARLGEGAETPLALRRTFPDFETEKRRDPSREDSPDTRWSLADYAAFCRAGGDSGLSGRRWRPPTIGEAAALVYPGRNAGGDSLRLPRRLVRVGIPGLAPSNNLRIPLPPHDGLDTWGPLPRGLMGAVNAGTPIVPGNEAGYSPTPGALWSAAVGLDGYGAFLPWESRIAGESARYLRGAVGYAACVVEAEDNYQPQPKLAVMEFSYAGKNVRCPVSARPAANCDEAGDFRSPDFIDSAFGDESAAAAVIPVSATGAGRVLQTVTLRALRFGGANGSAGVVNLPGEAALASVSQSGDGALTMALLSADDSFAVYAVSLRAEATVAGWHRNWFSASPRVGRAALLRFDAFVTQTVAPAAPRPAGPPLDAGGYRVFYVGAGYAGPLLTVLSFDGEESHGARANPNPSIAAQNGAALSAGSRVVSLSAPLSPAAQGALIRYALADNKTRIESVNENAAYLEVLVSLASGREATLQVAALLAPPHPALRVELGEIVPEVLATLPTLGPGESYADADGDDAFVIAPDGKIRLGRGERAGYLTPHQRATVTAAVVSQNSRGVFRVVEFVVNGASAPPPPPRTETHYLFPLVPRPNSNPFGAGQLGDDVAATVARIIPLSVPGRRFALAPDYAGPAGAKLPDNLPRGHSARFGACAPDPGVSLAPAGGDLMLNGALMSADSLFFSCPLLLPFDKPDDLSPGVDVAVYLPEPAWAKRHFDLNRSTAPLPRRYYERLFFPEPPPPGRNQVEVVRIRPATATATFLAYADSVHPDGASLSAGDPLTAADGRRADFAVVPTRALVMGAAARAQVWGALGAELQYGALSGDSAGDFELLPDGRVIARNFVGAGSYRLTVAATADGLLGTLTLPAEVRVIPARRFFATLPEAEGTDAAHSLPVAGGRRVEATPAAARTLLENGLQGTMSSDGMSFEISPLSPLGASDCLRMRFHLAVSEPDGAVAEYWDVDLRMGGVGAECGFVSVPVRSVKEIVRRIRGYSIVGEIWSGLLPPQVSVAAQIGEPDFSPLGMTLKFSQETASGQSPIFDEDDKLVGPGPVEAFNVMRARLELVEGLRLDLGARATVGFSLTVYRGASRARRDVLFRWDVRVEVRAAHEYNILFMSPLAEGEGIGRGFGLEAVIPDGGGEALFLSSLQTPEEFLLEDFWRAPDYFADDVNRGREFVQTSLDGVRSNRWPGRIVAADGSVLSPPPEIPADDSGRDSRVSFEIAPEVYGDISLGHNLQGRPQVGIRVSPRLGWRRLDAGAGRFRLTLYSGLTTDEDGKRAPDLTIPAEVLNVYYLILPPESEGANAERASAPLPRRDERRKSSPARVWEFGAADSARP